MSVVTSAEAVRRSVLVVDESSLLRGILREELEAEGFAVHLAKDGPEALALVHGVHPDIILLDVGLSGIDGYEVCRRVRADATTTEIPIVMVTALSELKDKLAGFEAGADDYVTKPFFTKELLARIRHNLRVRESVQASKRESASYLESLFGVGSTINIILSMVGAVDAKDAYTHGHSLRVARTSLIVAQERGLPQDELEPLLLSAILHDVGKIAVPDAILKKPGRLDRNEFEIMKRHPVAGAKMLQHIPALSAVIPGILHHHEYWDGSGYPHGLKGEEIPLQGRIIHIGDAFDAMTTDRIYRSKIDVLEALVAIRDNAGRQFDPDLVASLVAATRAGTDASGITGPTPSLHALIDRIR